eukprot:gene5664-6539_t
MSRNGTWQLKKLVLNYCDHSGSSKYVSYVRNLLPNGLQAFKDANPQIEFTEIINRGQHPMAIATYVSGKTKVVPLRGREEDKVIKHLQNLRDTSGFKPIKFGDRYIKKTDTIQGLWHPFLDLKSSSEQPSQQ